MRRWGGGFTWGAKLRSDLAWNQNENANTRFQNCFLKYIQTVAMGLMTTFVWFWED